MLLLANTLNDAPVMSLQTGSQIAHTSKAIVNPETLNVPAFWLNGPRLESQDTVLLTKDVREVSDIGLIIDSVDELVRIKEVVTLQKVMNYGFELIGIQVIDDMKHKLGKVSDYSIDSTTFSIQQLHVKPPFLKSLGVSNLLINRRQIIEVSNKTIVVSSASADQRPLPAKATRDFVNPFRVPSKPPTNASEN